MERTNRRAWLAAVTLVAALGVGCSDTTPVPGSCTADKDCAGSSGGSLCDTTRHVCVVCTSDASCGMGKKCDTTKNVCSDCLKDADCMPGSVCAGGSCKVGCTATSTCPTGKVCSMATGGACVDCAKDADCGTGKRCDVTSFTCVGCLADSDCDAGQVCHQAQCTAGCNANQHCPTGQVCDLSSGACVTCVGDGDCKTAGMLHCDAHLNMCVECVAGTDDCPAGEYCANDKCVAGCRTSSDCQAGSPSPASQGQVLCNVATHACVACLPGQDVCPIGSYCASDNTCKTGCRTDQDCQAGNPSPASQGLKRCVAATNTCVACLGDSDCPQGQVCGTDHTCSAGCNSDAKCGVGLYCCSGACAAVNTTTNCGACGVSCSQGQGCCNAACTDLKTTQNCGGCGITCTAGQTCCGAGCANLLTDANNCGSCGNACASGQICCSGTCKSPNAPGNCVDCTKACQTYGVSGASFSSGTISQLNADSSGLSTIPAAQNPKPAAPPHIWIANHDSNQISKIDANTGAFLGTFPSGGGNPSRGAMALDGTFWVGHRGQNCNVNDPNCSNVVNMNTDGTIRCTVKYAADGATLPFVRALAIDKNGFVWAGTFNDSRAHKIDPNTCTTLLDIPMTGSCPYGFIVDGNGILWNSTAGCGNYPVLGIDTVTAKIKYTTPFAISTYGITADKSNDIWLAQWCGTNVYRIDGTTHALSTIPVGGVPGGYCPRGMTVDLDGNVWAAMWASNATSYVSKFAPTGTFIKSFQQNTLFNSVAIAGDAYGNVWLAGCLASTGNCGAPTGAIRFPRAISADNQIDFLTRMQGAYPYSYSDWTGLVVRTVTSNDAQDGTWTQSWDGGSASTVWSAATWTANVPTGTQAKLRFKAASTYGGLASAPACGPFFSTQGANRADLTTCNFGQKQWIAVFVELSTNDVNNSASIDNLQLYYQQ